MVPSLPSTPLSAIIVATSQSLASIGSFTVNASAVTGAKVLHNLVPLPLLGGTDFQLPKEPVTNPVVNEYEVVEVGNATEVTLEAVT